MCMHKYPLDSWIHAMFEKQARMTPKQPAIRLGEVLLTYDELNKEANRLARVLISQGIKCNDIVGMMLNRSTEMIVSALAILKAGAAFLPIDPDYPIERTQYILRDSRVSVLLTNIGLEGLDYTGRAIDPSIQQLDGIESTNLNIDTKPNDLAYIIYTSGTTGRPKGVMIEHAAISNTIQFRRDEYKLVPTDKVLQLFSYAFDGFIASLFTPLTSGALSVLMYDAEAKDPAMIKQYIAEHAITHVIIVPTLYASVLELLSSDEANSLRMVTLAGEKISIHHLTRSKEKNPNIEIINEYGPTENSVSTSLQRNVSAHNIQSIGKPNANNRVYIINHNDECALIGEPGELCISGASLARGYLNLPHVTNEKFVDNPYEPGNLMYRTGDLAKWLPNGTIAYLGRIDNQVKLRGYRIELDEIEANLSNHPSINEAAVLLQTDDEGSDYLCAYLVDSGNLELYELHEYLNKRIPAYMIPTLFKVIERMPFTINGKVDKAALLKCSAITLKNQYVAPSDDAELKLVHIWKGILGIDRVGVYDNFFHMGGHSLKAAVLTTSIQKQFHVQLSLSDLFKHCTIRELASYIRNAKQQQFEPIETAKQQAYYPVSAAQKRIYIINTFEGIGTTYNNPILIPLPDHIALNQLQDSLNQIMNRYESFRTSFHIYEGEIVQKIDQDVQLQLAPIEVDNEQDVDRAVQACIQPFDMGVAPLLRASAIHLTSTNSRVLVLDMHHIITDGVSLHVFLKELGATYNGEALDQPSIQYKDYAQWSNASLQDEEIKQSWVDRLQGDIPILNIPYDYPRPKVLTFKGDTVKCSIDMSVIEKLKSNLQDETTLYMAVLAVYHVLLSKYSGQEDVIVGAPMAGRIHHDIQYVLGMFVNTLPIRSYPKGELAFHQFVLEIRQSVLHALEHQNVQIETIIHSLQLKRDSGRQPLFDTVFNYRNADECVVELDGNKLAAQFINNRTSKFDMTLTLVESTDSIQLELEFNTGLFKQETMERFAEHFIHILTQVSEQPDILISDIETLSVSERNKFIQQFVNDSVTYPDTTIIQIYEERVRQYPDHIAVSFGNQNMTYEALNANANRLARTLRNNDVGADRFVALVLDRSVDMIVAMLAVLKSGGAYVPIDPDYPSDRIQYTIESSGADLVLTQVGYRDRFDHSHHVICIDTVDAYDADESNLEHKIMPSDLAYMIYTSGSTGKPKGVLIEHGNVVRLLFNSEFQFEFNYQDIWTMFHSYCFDFSVWEMYGALLYGGKIVVVPKIVAQSTQDFLELLHEEKVTVLNQTPTAFYLLSNQERLNEIDDLKLRYIIFGGEALNPSKLKQWKRTYPHTKLINMYGITETTVHVTYKEITDAEIEMSTSNIGTPIPTLYCHLFDRYQKYVPVGVVGELYVGGAGVGRGYHKNEELTAARFIVNPYNNEERLYRSGDLARLLPNGELEYLGRMDHQVKIRGFRIELGEIEVRLLKHPSIESMYVIPKVDQHGDAYLCAYYTTTSSITFAEIRSFGSQTLPSYMIPSIGIALDSMPMTSNGKLDRKALPEPEEVELSNAAAHYVAPSNETEQRILSIWENILKVSTIGVHDKFFEIGGHSLKVTLLVHEMNKQCNITISFLDVYTHDTIHKLAQLVTGEVDSQATSHPDVVMLKQGDSDKNMFFIHGGNGKVNTYAELCRYGITGYNCVGIEAEVDNIVGLKLLQLQDYARRYVSIIKSYQPTGPYHIFGTCIGGTIAFEVAKQLEEMGDRDIFLALVSAEPPNEPVASAISLQSIVEEERAYVGSLSDLVPGQREYDGHAVEVDSMWDKVIKLLDSHDISYEIVKALLQEELDENMSYSMVEYLKGVNDVRSLSLLRSRYVPSNPINALVIYYGASEYDIDNKMLWQQYCNQPILFSETKGDHFTIFKEPNVGRFAQLASKHFAKLNNEL